MPLPLPADEGRRRRTWLDVPNASRARTVAAMDAALGAGAGEDWDRLLDRAHQVWQVTRGPFLESPLDGPRDLVRLARRTSDVRTVAPWSTLRGLGRSHLRDPRLRMLLDRYATYTGSDPRRAPAALAVVPYVEQTFGALVRARRPRVGWRTRCTSGRCCAASTCGPAPTVTGVVVEGGRAAGVGLADGERLAADVVVANADATHLYGDLVPAHGGGLGPPPAGPRDAVAVRLRAAAGAARPHARAGPPHRAVPGRDYDAEFDAVFGRDARPVEDPTRLRQRAGRPGAAAGRGTRRGSSWSTRRGTAPAPGASTGARRASPRRTPTGCSTVLAGRGLDVRDRVLWREVRTPGRPRAATRSPGGAIYGTSSNGARAAFLRPANRSPVPGLFLVGGSAHPGGGLPLVGLSAAIVADLVGPA